jgi:hypothetical protein
MRIAAMGSVLSLTDLNQAEDIAREIQFVLVCLKEISALIVNANHTSSERLKRARR